MSAATTQDLEAAIRAHIADEYPETLVSEWVLVAALVEPGADRGDMIHIYEDSDLPSHHATGLLTSLVNRLEHQAVTGGEYQRHEGICHRPHRTAARH